MDGTSCGACDICLGHFDSADNAEVIAQKIISGVMRLGERFGAAYTTQTLIGSKEKRILELGHDSLSTYGILAEFSQRAVRDWVEQLVSQDYLQKTGEFNVLTVTDKGHLVLRGEDTPRLIKPAEKPAKVSKAATDNWEGVDRDLFEKLRALRMTVAKQSGSAPYIVFHDSSLRDMARKKPISRTGFLEVHGVGESKVKKYADEFLEAIREFSTTEQLHVQSPKIHSPAVNEGNRQYKSDTKIVQLGKRHVRKSSHVRKNKRRSRKKRPRVNKRKRQVSDRNDSSSLVVRAILGTLRPTDLVD